MPLVARIDSDRERPEVDMDALRLPRAGNTTSNTTSNTRGDFMKSRFIAALAALAIIAGAAPVAAQPLSDRDQSVATIGPAGTIEYDAFYTTLTATLDVTWRSWERLTRCDSWACVVAAQRRIDDTLTEGIQWLYHHPALPCFQQQQQRATKGLQETRGAFRMLLMAVQTGSHWRQRVARTKITAAQGILQGLPAHTCPAGVQAAPSAARQP
jgi:hypothetical protein